MQVSTFRGAPSLKHTQVTGNLKISASKKRKLHQQMIKALLENILDSNAEASIAKDNRSLQRYLRSEQYKRKYGNLQYAADGVTIL